MDSYKKCQFPITNIGTCGGDSGFIQHFSFVSDFSRGYERTPKTTPTHIIELLGYIIFKYIMIYKNLLILITGVVFVVSVGCSDHTTKEEHRQALLKTLESRGRAMAEGNVKKILSYWTDDIVIYPVSKPAVKGIAAVQEYVRKNRQELGLKPKLTPLEVVTSESGDLGYIVGTYEWIDRNGHASNPGRYVAMWRKNQQGEWKCFLEIHSPAS